MPTSDPIELLVKTNDWANRQLLDACKNLSHDQLHQKFEMGPGSLHDTITHILGAMRGWSDLLADREQRPRLEGTQRSVEELAELHQEISADLASLAAAHPSEELVSGSRGGRDYTFSRGAVITHVTTHGMHHRAQCLNMLRQLGVQPLPPSAVVEWVLTEDSD